MTDIGPRWFDYGGSACPVRLASGAGRLVLAFAVLFGATCCPAGACTSQFCCNRVK